MPKHVIPIALGIFATMATFPTGVTAHPATLRLTATVYDVHPYSSKEKVYEGTTKVGEDSSTCTKRTSSTIHCIGSYKLTNGTILFSGTISNSSNTNRLAITGGTGRYKNVRGAVLTEFNKAGTKAKETITFA
jgi:hypothetical protein